MQSLSEASIVIDHHSIRPPSIHQVISTLKMQSLRSKVELIVDDSYSMRPLSNRRVKKCHFHAPSKDRPLLKVNIADSIRMVGSKTDVQAILML